MYAMGHVCSWEDNLRESALFYHQVSPEDETQIARLGSLFGPASQLHSLGGHRNALRRSQRGVFLTVFWGNGQSVPQWTQTLCLEGVKGVSTSGPLTLCSHNFKYLPTYSFQFLSSPYYHLDFQIIYKFFLLLLLLCKLFFLAKSGSHSASSFCSSELFVHGDTGFASTSHLSFSAGMFERSKYY